MKSNKTITLFILVFSLIGAILKISISSTVFVFLFHNKTTVQIAL
jgi:hypothetical protein